MKKLIGYEEIEDSYFECACHNRDDMIIARHFVWGEKTEDGIIIHDNDIYFSFVCQHCYIPTGDYFFLIQWTKKLFWRIREALKILFIGSIRVEGEWWPERFLEDDENENGSLNGAHELERFSAWLKRAIKASKNNYKKSIKRKQ